MTPPSQVGCSGAGCDCPCHQGPSYPVFRVDPCPRCNVAVLGPSINSAEFFAGIPPEVLRAVGESIRTGQVVVLREGITVAFAALTPATMPEGKPLTFAAWVEQADLECSVGMAEVVWNVALEQAQEAIAERLLRMPASVAAAPPELLRQRELCGLEVIAAVRGLQSVTRGG